MCGYSDFKYSNDSSSSKAAPSCASPYLLKDVLRGRWASPAVVQSDCCDSVSDIYIGHRFTPTLEDAVAVGTNAGTQLIFGGNVTASRIAMVAALAAGKVTKEQLQANVARALLTRFRLGEFDGGTDGNPFGSVNGKDLIPTIDSAEHRAIARRTAAESCVLLKNDKETLPLLVMSGGRSGGNVEYADWTMPANKDEADSESILTMAVIGPYIDDANALLHSYSGQPSFTSTPLAALQAAFGSTGTKITFAEGISSSVGGGGGPSPPGAAANISAAASLAAAADVTIAVLGLGSRVECESVDRGEGPGNCPGGVSGDCLNTTAKGNLGFPLVQQTLLAALRKAAKKLVLVIVAAGPVSIDPTMADAIVWAGYGGEEAGNGLVDALTGKTNAWGKMAVTTYAADYLSKVGPLVDWAMASGVGRTYRYLDTAKSTPIFGFGFGLSLTTFEFSDLHVTADASSGGATVTANITNTGSVAGAEVVQLYVQLFADPSMQLSVPPPRLSLQGFQKPFLHPGQSKTLRFQLVARQLSIAQDDGTWQRAKGTFVVHVGGHQPESHPGAGAAHNSSSNVLSTQALFL
jgi:beta-glucosidase